jgi:hypothetical protein
LVVKGILLTAALDLALFTGSALGGKRPKATMIISNNRHSALDTCLEVSLSLLLKKQTAASSI